MIDIQLLRKDIDAVVAKLQARKTPQPCVDEATFQALESERKTIQVRCPDRRRYGPWRSSRSRS